MVEQLDMLAEHQAPAKEEKPSNRTAVYSPTEKEKAADELVEKLLERSKAAKDPYSSTWMRRYKFYRGQQWLRVRSEYRHSEVINLIFQAIQSTSPMMTDSRPEISYIAREPNDQEIAEILTQVETAEWSNQNWLMDLSETVLDGYIYGTGVMNPGYDPDALNGLGRVTLDSFDPFFLFPDPCARDVNKKSRYTIAAEPTDVDIVKAKYPDKAGYIEPDISDLISYEKNAFQRPAFYAEQDHYYPTDVESRSAAKASEKKEQCLLITAYIKNDYDTEEVEGSEVDELGNETKTYTQKVKYPKGRKIVKCGKVILEDTEMDCDSFPFARFVNYILPREFWGMSEVEQLESPQMIFNKIVSFTLDVLNLTGNPVWIISSDSGIDTDQIYNAPGEILEPTKGADVRRIEGAQLQPYVMQLIDRLKLWFDDISGAQDVTRGTSVGGVTAASAIESLQQASHTRIRQKMRNMDMMLQDVGRIHLYYILNNYSAPRVFRLTNKDGANKYFKMHVEKDEEGKKQLVYQPYKQTETGYTEDIDGVRRSKLIGEFDVSVNTVSGLPFLKSERESKALQLYDRQIIDAEELLKVMEYPNKEAVLARMRQAQQQGAQANAATNAQPT